MNDALEGFRKQLEVELLDVYRQMYTSESQVQLVAQSVARRVLNHLELTDLADQEKLEKAIARETRNIVKRLPPDREPGEVAQGLMDVGRQKAREGQEAMDKLRDNGETT